MPGYAKYKPIETTYDLKKLEVPGVYVVKVTDEKTLQATTLVLGSDLDAIVKASREQVLVFAQDMKTGKGRAGARVLVADGDGRDPRGEDGRRRRPAPRLGQAAGTGAGGPPTAAPPPPRAVPPPPAPRPPPRTLPRTRRRRPRARPTSIPPRQPHLRSQSALPRPRRRRRRRLGPGRPRARSRRGSPPGPTSTPTGPPTGRARRSSCAASSARSRTASTPTSPGRPTGSRSPTAGAGSSSIAR